MLLQVLPTQEESTDAADENKTKRDSDSSYLDRMARSERVCSETDSSGKDGLEARLERRVQWS